VIVVIPALRLPSHIRTATGNDRSSFTVAKRLDQVTIFYSWIMLYSVL
jgi:hypothetical protein